MESMSEESLTVLVIRSAGQAGDGTVAVAVEVTASPLGGVALPVAVLATEPAAMSSAPTLWVAAASCGHDVVAPTAKVATQRPPPLSAGIIGSVTFTLVSGTLPV